MQADNAKEFIGGEFNKILEKEASSSNLSPPYTPELNGVAERYNRTFGNKIRALMIDSGLPESMWVCAVDYANHIYNRTPH